MEYTAGRAELIGRMEPMWKRLNEHHRSVSPHYADFYAGFTFEGRTADTEAMGDRVRIIIAHQGDRDAGYIMAVIDGDCGEISSLYVEPEYRGGGIADNLMAKAKEWLAHMGAKKLFLTVTYGNERAFSFYRRHGFYPRLTRLELKEERSE